MLQSLKRLHPSNVLGANLKQLKKMVQDKQFDLQRFKLSSRALYLLARWACAFVRYSDIIEKVQPRQSKIEELERRLIEMKT